MKKKTLTAKDLKRAMGIMKRWKNREKKDERLLRKLKRLQKDFFVLRNIVSTKLDRKEEVFTPEVEIAMNLLVGYERTAWAKRRFEKDKKYALIQNI